MADNIDNAVNYSIVAEETKNFVRDQSTSLIETLADGLATHLLKTFRIQNGHSRAAKISFRRRQARLSNCNARCIGRLTMRKGRFDKPGNCR